MSTVIHLAPVAPLHPRMLPDVEATWQRICAHSLDEPHAPVPFSARLAREQRWSADFTQLAILEYKRFALLAVTSPREVTPSDVVDQVWHTHLTYTREYWDTFCGQVLGAPLHHTPGRGDSASQGRHLQHYARTLERYRQAFDEEPPSDIWPAVSRRFAPEHASVRVNAREHFVVPWRVLHTAALVAVAGTLGLPLLVVAMLNADGWALATLCLLAEAATLTAAESLRSRPLAEEADGGTSLHPYEATLLLRDAATTADSAIANLVARGCLSYHDGKLHRRRPLFAGAHPLERNLYEAVGATEGSALAAVQQLATTAPCLKDLAARLRSLGLTGARALNAPYCLVLLVPAVLLIVSAVRGDSLGVPLLASLCALGLAHLRFRNDSGLTARGRAALRRFERTHPQLTEPRPSAYVGPGDLLPALVALRGIDALRSHPLGELANALTLSRLQQDPDACVTSGGCGCGG